MEKGQFLFEYKMLLWHHLGFELTLYTCKVKNHLSSYSARLHINAFLSLTSVISYHVVIH